MKSLLSFGLAVLLSGCVSVGQREQEALRKDLESSLTIGTSVEQVKQVFDSRDISYREWINPNEPSLDAKESANEHWQQIIEAKYAKAIVVIEREYYVLCFFGKDGKLAKQSWFVYTPF